MLQHKELANGKWFKMTIAEQLGNVGSEYERADKWVKTGNKELFASAFKRFLELLDLTISDKRWDLFRKQELLRVREVGCENLTGKNNKNSLSKYFYDFALLSRKSK